MTTFTATVGLQVVSRDTAEQVGSVQSLVVDVPGRRVAALVVGQGRKSVMVPWDGLSGIGPDAVMVVAEDRLQPPADDAERLAASGRRDLLGRRTLDDRGVGLGSVDDVDFDAESGALVSLLVDGNVVAADRLRGAGTYAVVVEAAADDAPA